MMYYRKHKAVKIAIHKIIVLIFTLILINFKGQTKYAINNKTQKKGTRKMQIESRKLHAKDAHLSCPKKEERKKKKKKEF